MTTDGIIFDIDGTIWDATESLAIAFNEVLQKDGRFQKTIRREDMLAVMGMTNEEIADIFFNEFSQCERRELMEMCCGYECEYLIKHGGKLYPKVEEVLCRLAQHYALFIVSNCANGYIESLFTVYDIRKYFRDFECSGNTGLAKEDNIKLIMERNHLHHAIYVGDTIKDKKACEKAGIPFIYASYGFGDVDTYDKKIECFSQLMDLLSEDFMKVDAEI